MKKGVHYTIFVLGNSLGNGKTRDVPIPIIVLVPIPSIRVSTHTYSDTSNAGQRSYPPPAS